MNQETKALLRKEWIKLRAALLIASIMLGYGVINCWLFLQEIYRSGGYFGLAMTIIDKPPYLFADFKILLVAAVIIGFAQVWPEAQRKRLRILFHMPIAPERIIGITLATGVISIVSLFLLAAAAQLLLYLNYHMPAEQITDQLLSFSTWLFRALGLYGATVAFFASSVITIRLFALICGYFTYDVAAIWGFQLNLPSFPQYLLLVILALSLATFAYLDFKHRAKQGVSYRVHRLATMTLTSFSLAYLVHSVYWDIATPSMTQQNLYYSQVNNEFVVFNALPERKNGAGGARTMVYHNQAGDTLTEEAYKQALPFLYGLDLVKWNLWPEQIGGLALTVEQARQGWSKNRFTPDRWNTPEITIHRLIETNPKGSRYKLPRDLMRLSSDRSKLEFYRPIEGELDQEKGKRFTRALVNAGVQMPIQMLSNNSQIRKKRFDNGFIIADSQNNLFQMKMANGQPWVRSLGLTIPGELRGLSINEDRLKRYMAYATTKSQLYAVTQEAKPRLQVIEIDDYDVDYTTANFMPDLLGIAVTSKNSSLPYTDRPIVGQRLSLDGENEGETFSLPMEAEDNHKIDLAIKLSSMLIPVRVLQSSKTSEWADLRIETRWSQFAPYCALGILLSLAVMIWRWRSQNTQWRPEDVILVLVFGPLGLLVAELVNHRNNLLGRHR